MQISMTALSNYLKGDTTMFKHYKLRACIFLFALLTATAMLTGTNASATEGSGGAGANGAEDIYAGALPPAGLYYLNYFSYYTAGRLNNGNGDKAPVSFNLDATANIFRFVYMTDKKILGGYFGTQVILPLVNLNVSAGGHRENKSGLGDIQTSPVILAYHGKNWHVATGCDVFLPVGNYKAGDLANIGRNYWTFEPVLAATFTDDSGLEFSSKLMYDINTRNSDTHYLSGQEFHGDFALAYHWNKWTVAANSYFYKQVTDDKLNGNTVAASPVNAAGNKGQVLGVGPAIKYDYKNMSLTLKYQTEILAENKPEGDRFWVKFMYAF